MSNKIIHFKETIKKSLLAPGGSWHFVDFPENTFEVFGRRGHIRIKGLINNQAFYGNLFPVGSGRHIITIPLKLQKQIGIKLHQEISLSIEEDFEEIFIEMPVELKEALDFDEEMAELFNKLSPANQKYQKMWVNSGKLTETRIKRVVKIFEKLSKGDYRF